MSNRIYITGQADKKISLKIVQIKKLKSNSTTDSMTTEKYR